MKLILFFAKEFWFTTYQKVLSDVEDFNVETHVENSVVVFFQAESVDETRFRKVVTKFVKNTKWLAGKFSTQSVVLHSFNHLSSSKAPPETAMGIIKEVIKRLKRTGYNVFLTPFGYQNEWRLHVAGESLAKVFKEI